MTAATIGKPIAAAPLTKLSPFAAVGGPEVGEVFGADTPLPSVSEVLVGLPKEPTVAPLLPVEIDGGGVVEQSGP
jgi:hypothetical protein